MNIKESTLDMIIDDISHAIRNRMDVMAIDVIKGDYMNIESIKKEIERHENFILKCTGKSAEWVKSNLAEDEDSIIYPHINKVISLKAQLNGLQS